MRLAAERTARYVAAAARGYGLPEQAPWEAAAAALGAERGRVDADLPLEGHGALPPLPAPKVRPSLAARFSWVLRPCHPASLCQMTSKGAGAPL